MSEADAVLKDLFAGDAPPARDRVFELAVMERIERRRFWFEALMRAPLLLAACVALWALGPMLSEATVSLVGPLAQGALLPALAIVVTLASMTLAGRGPARA